MKLAVLILCHKEPTQIQKFISALSHPDITVFVHVDKKAGTLFRQPAASNVILLPDEARVNVKWATISPVDATLALLRYAEKTGSYDYYFLCSGQDFPLMSPAAILSFLSKDPTCNYINLAKSKNYQLGKANHLDKRNQIVFPHWLIDRKLYLRVLKRAYIEFTGGYNKTYRLFARKNTSGMPFFFGSMWWCLTGNAVHWILEYLTNHPAYYNYFSKCICPDESFFQTLIMNSPFQDTVTDYLHYIVWHKGESSPKVLTQYDMPAMIKSGKLIARKFDRNIDEKVIDMLAERICLQDQSHADIGGHN